MARDYTPIPFEFLDELDGLSDEEYGRLIRAMQKYSIDGNEPEISGTERLFWKRCKNTVDRYKASYESRYAANAENGSKGGRPRKRTGFQETEENPKNPAGFQETQKSQPEPETKPKPEPYSPPLPPKGESAPARQAKKPHGEYGWVKLTDDEFNRLLNDFGEDEVKRCIAYVDESAQSTGNKNKWRDWNLVIRKCHRDGWGRAKSANTRSGYTSGVDRLAEMYREEFGNG